MRPRSAAILLTILAFAGWLAWVSHFWFVTDDAFISYRFARNWVEGSGLCYNPTEAYPVEGYSNFLWVAASALVLRLGGSPEACMPILSTCAAVGLLAVVHRAARQRLGLSAIAAACATLVLALSPGFVVWTTGGLAVAPMSLALFVTFERWVLGSSRRDFALGAVAAVVLTLLRIEGFAWVVVVAVLAWARHLAEGQRAHSRPLGQALAVVLGVFVAFSFWRWMHFGTLVANTVAAKVEFDAHTFLRGLDYVAGFWLDTVSSGVVLFAALAAWPFARWRGLAVAAMAFGVPLYAVLIGGDFMAMGRVLVPGLAFGALLVGFAVELALRRGRVAGGIAVALALATGGVGTLALLDIHPVPESLRASRRVRWNASEFRSEISQWQFMRQNAERWSRVGAALAQVAHPTDSIVLPAIGAIGYYSRLHVYDCHGLVSPEVVAAGNDEERARSPGHDRHVPVTYFLDRDPMFLYADVWKGVPGLRRIPERVETWRDPELESRYAPRVYPVTLDGEDVWWLLVLERTDHAEPVWDEFEGELERLLDERLRRSRGDR